MSNFVTIENNENEIKLKNLFNIAKFIGFLWLLFHFTIIFFFGLILESPLLVGIFLGLGNLVAVFVDIPIGVIQKYVKPKTLLISSTIIMLLTTLIFLKFVYFEGIDDLLPGGNSGVDRTISYLGNFLNSTFNIILLLLASCFYGLIKESYDVTTLSYIFNNSTPSEYASLISKYNINFGIGAMSGLIFSGILLAFDIRIAIFVIVLIIFSFTGFIHVFFDNTKKYIGVKDIKKIKNIKLDVIKSDFSKKGENLVKNININSLKEISRESKVIFLKPIEIKNSINVKEIIDFSKKEFLGFKNIIFSKPLNIVILWLLLVIFHYGFWDTFVSTFQVEFLNKIIGLNQNNYLIKQTGGLITGYLLLGLLVIPAFLLQDFFIKLSKKINVFNTILLGSVLSAISMMFFGFVDKLYLVILFGLVNSVGYAAVMPIAQATFSEKYNYYYAIKNNLKEVDTTVSAAPLKIILNFVNVIGLILGGILVGILGFNGFFIVFSLFLSGLFIFTVLNLKKLKESEQKEGSQEISEERLRELEIDKDFV